MFDVLYQNDCVLIVQTHAGQFDKWGDDLYGSLNLGRHVGDDGEQVLKNRMALVEALNQVANGQISELHWLNQIHSDIVVDTKATIVPQNADALITDRAGVGLSIMTADCVPIALFDDRHGQVACIHAGWQGLAKGIIQNTASRFDGAVKAVMGACISQANYEISQALAHDIISQVVQKNLVALTFDELYRAVVKDKDDGKCLIDIVQLTQLQLTHLNITLIGETVPCSYADPRFYSYRQQVHAQKRATGRMAMVVVKLVSS